MEGTQSQTLIPSIKKRSGAVVAFNQDKITLALTKAFHTTGKENESLALKISDKVFERLLQERQEHPEDSIPTVEHIQDLVEEELMRAGETKTAKSYILYRQKHAEERDMKRTMLGMPVDTKVGINQLRVLKERYLLRDEIGKIKETPEQLWRRVADNIAQAELNSPTNYGNDTTVVKEWSDKFYTLMEKMAFMPNSPTLMNAGTPMQQLSACFVLPVEDSLEGIYETMKNQALIHQSGGGTGFSFSRLRPKGSLVKSTKGVATGPVGFMSVYNASTEVIKQGGKRRGANMGILRVDHPDIREFIHCKDDITKINNFNISVAITEAFMEAVEKDEDFDLIDPHSKKVVARENARALYDDLVASAWKSGDPGIIFIDRINRDNPVPHVHEIEATNPCVAGDTRVSTEKGLMRMDDLAARHPEGGLRIGTDCRIPITYMDERGMIMFMDQDQGNLNLRYISHAFSSGVKPVYKLTTHSGYEMEATADHKIFTIQGKKKLGELIPKKDEVLIQCQEGAYHSNFKLPFDIVNTVLGKNRRTYRLNLPTHWSKELGQTLGWLTGDGWLRTGDKNVRVGFTFSQEDYVLLPYFKPIINSFYGRYIKEFLRENGVYHLSYHSKFFVSFFLDLGVPPVDCEYKTVPTALFTAPREAVIGYLQGLFSADGTVRNSKKSGSDWIALTSKSIQLLKEVQLLLLNLGIKSQLFNRH
ncbi:MAG: ribonucleotide reductase N-terminal alpha domain-containing protein, partial [archaeon]|nr:ribonucleotide reductase N-terminal alpha domain-containing protein [archaeon]